MFTTYRGCQPIPSFSLSMIRNRLMLIVASKFISCCGRGKATSWKQKRLKTNSCFTGNLKEQQTILQCSQPRRRQCKETDLCVPWISTKSRIERERDSHGEQQEDLIGPTLLPCIFTLSDFQHSN